MPASTATLAPLTSVRFLAALRVALYHFVKWESKTFWWRGLMLTPISVSYFFVASGFLLAYNYAGRFDRHEMNYRSFYLGRCVRLLPVYFLGLLVAFPLLFWPAPLFSLRKVALTVFLLQSWFPDSALYWNGPAWALSTLAFFYAVLPVLLFLTRSISTRACLSLATFAWLVSIALPLVYMHWNPDGLYNINSLSSGFWLYILKYNPLLRLPEFFVGVMAGRLYLRAGSLKPGTCTVVFLVAGTILLAALLIGPKLPYPIINSGVLAPVLALLVYNLASGGLGARLFRPQWFVTLGQSSFCLYMLHVPLWYLAHLIPIANTDKSHLVHPIILVVIVALSLFLYRWVEMPATKALRAFFHLTPAASAARLSGE